MQEHDAERLIVPEVLSEDERDLDLALRPKTLTSSSGRSG